VSTFNDNELSNYNIQQELIKRFQQAPIATATTLILGVCGYCLLEGKRSQTPLVKGKNILINGPQGGKFCCGICKDHENHLEKFAKTRPYVS
jgi:hypothetical protein